MSWTSFARTSICCVHVRSSDHGINVIRTVLCMLRTCRHARVWRHEMLFPYGCTLPAALISAAHTCAVLISPAHTCATHTCAAPISAALISAAHTCAAPISVAPISAAHTCALLMLHAGWLAHVQKNTEYVNLFKIPSIIVVLFRT